MAEPCPLDEWVYRGQPAQYENIIPSALRSGNAGRFTDRLADLDPRSVNDLLMRSPVRAISAHMGEVIDANVDLTLEGPLSYLAHRTAEAPTPSTIIRALGQHYGFPTCFVDLSTDPWVAAAFATVRDGTILPNTETPGTVFRWPARRRSRSHLTIENIDAVDLSGISPHFRRPVVQASVLAIPVSLPPLATETVSIPGVSRHFPSTLPSLASTDISLLSCCERFNLYRPEEGPRAVRDFALLFPNSIDLGYAYLTASALLSLITVFPENDDHYEPLERRTLKQQFELTLHAMTVVLARQASRLVPSLPLGPEVRTSLPSAVHGVMSQVEIAGAAPAIIDCNANSFMARRALDRRRALLRLIPSLSSRISEHSPLDVMLVGGKLFAAPVEDGELDFSWVCSEVTARSQAFLEVADWSGMAPAWALVDPPSHESLIDTFPVGAVVLQDTVRAASALGDSDRWPFPIFPSSEQGARR